MVKSLLEQSAAHSMHAEHTRPHFLEMLQTFASS